MTTPGLAHAALQAGEPLVAAVYSRVSADARDDERSVGQQDDDNREACAAEGWQIGGVYCDNDKSASRFATKGREDWDRLLEDLSSRRFHVVVLWESSRGDRRLAHWVLFLDTCRDLGVLIHITAHERTYDPRKRRDYKTLAEEGLDSHDDSEKTSERVRRDKRNAAKKGLPAGRSLYGYRRVYEVLPNGQRRLVEIVFDEEPRTTIDRDGTEHVYTHADVVREIFERISTGDSLRSVTVDFNLRGIPSPRNGKKGWHASRIREIATNPAYVGQRVHQGVVLPGVETVWPPLVEQDQFQACVARFNRPGRAKHLEGAVKRLMAGLATCGVCGRVVRRMGPREKPLYVCAPDNRMKFGPTTGYCVARKVADVDAYVERSVWLRLIRPDIQDLLQVDEQADKRRRRLLAEVTEKQNRLQAARVSFAQGKLPLEALEVIEETLTPEIERATALMTEARVAPVLRDFIGGDLEAVQAEWARRSIPQRREVIRALVEKIEIRPLYGRKKYLPEESVRIVWRQPRAAGEPEPPVEADTGT